MAASDRDITQYLPDERDARIENPYLGEVLALAASPGSELAACRAELISRYAFPIPTADILDALLAHAPIVEIGAGSGYWAWCLSQLGASVVAYDTLVPGEGSEWDPFSRNAWFDDTWFGVIEGDESAAARHPDRSLFLCWPPFHVPMASRALAHYRDAGGRTLLYIGNPASSGDAPFHEALGRLAAVAVHRLWSWPGTDEALHIYALQ